MLRVQYDSSSGDILGYYPTNINYNNVDVETQTIDGHPYVQISESEKTLHKQMEVKNGVYQERIKDPSVIRADLLAQQIQNIKEEASRRINKEYPLWKQSNIQGQAIDILCCEQQQKAIDPSYSISEQDKTVLREAKSVKSGIAYLQEKSNALEASLTQLSIEELETFNCADESNWA